MEQFHPPPEADIGRNAHIFAGNGDYLGGLCINDPPQVSIAAFYRICAHFIIFPSPIHQPNENDCGWSIYPITPSNNPDSIALPRTSSSPLQKGRYAILSASASQIPLSITTEPALHRLETPEPKGPGSKAQPEPSDPRYPRNKLHFEDRILARDGRVCAITGLPEQEQDRLFMLKATHIFPVSMREGWVRNGLGDKWIRKDPDDYDDEGNSLSYPDGLFSPQNGLLLDIAAKFQWDLFHLTVDPDDDYRCVLLCEDTRNQGGRRLNFSSRDPQRLDRVSDECLRWHYHQSVLTLVRGLGADQGWSKDVMYENTRDAGEYDEEDLDKERESVKKCLEWEFGS
ncbi:hypothetical protein BJX64DRAFT_287241 [Aspergillus heterothallicus]